MPGETIRVQYQPTLGGAWTTINADAIVLHALKIGEGYSHPAMLAFRIMNANSPGNLATPIPQRAGIRVYDIADAVYNNGDSPLFSGYVEEVLPDPNDSRTINYRCLDETKRAAAETTVHNGAWEDNPTPGGKPIKGNNTYPRLVMNVTIETDDDFAYSRGQDLTVAEMLQKIFDDHAAVLRYHQAAPADLSDPYDAADMSGENFDFKPQEKFVIESENFRTAIDRLLGLAPKHRVIYHPETKLWRIRALPDAPTMTLTLNDHTADKVVLSMQLIRSMEGRATAIRIVGPEKGSAPQLAYWFDPPTSDDSPPETLTDTLVPIGTPVYYPDITGALTVPGYRQWQVVDPDKQRLLRVMPSEAYRPDCNPLLFVLTRFPTLSALWPPIMNVHTLPGPDLAERGSFCPVAGIILDVQNGIITCPQPLVRERVTGSTSASSSVTYYESPTAVEFLFSCLTDPFFVRYPATEDTFAGTAYSVGGMEFEYEEYDDMLAIGWEFGIPVTSVERLAQFLKYAKAMHQARSDIVWTGGLVIDGIHTDLLRLNRRINIAAVDGNGDAMITGLEAIAAWVTDVELDYEESLTTLTFSSDELELLGFDPERMKQLLKIHTLQQFQTNEFKVEGFGVGGLKYSYQSIFRYMDDGRIVSDVIR